MPAEDPWTIDAAAWPPAGDDTAGLAAAARYAILAPSGHNTQPWRLRLRDGGLDLLADRRRRLPVVDPADRALTISCGAALALLRTALRRFGHEARVTPLPDPARPDLLARVVPGAAHAPTTQEMRLFAAIPHRHTARGAYRPEPLPPSLPRTMRDLATTEGVECAVIADPARRAAIAALVERGDRAQFADPLFRAELAGWVRSQSLGARDGMSGRGFGMPDLASPLFALALRHIDLGGMVGARDRDAAASAPALLVLASAEDTPRAWLATGQALAMVLLAATAEAVRAAFLNQPVEVAALRPELRARAGLSGVPQLLLRLGRAPEAPASARRPLRDVLEA